MKRIVDLRAPAALFAITLLLANEVKAAVPPSTTNLSGPALVEAQARLQQGEPRLTAALAQLRGEADRLLTLKPASVMDIGPAAPGDDPHDYLSLAPYWWPNPEKPDRLPYIQHDGKVNPESKRRTDSVAFARTCNAVETLGLAYWFTGDERYVAKAAKLVRVWFLDPATHMNPNLEHAQAIRGRNTGRGTGSIEGRNFIALMDGLALIAGAKAWPEGDAAAMRTWLGSYYQWLISSQHGADEEKSVNNHGSWYDAQAADLALVLGMKDDVKTIVAAAKTKRITRQIEPDGSQPLELSRTRSLNYVLFNLEALSTLARFGTAVGEDLWGFATPDGRTLKKAVAYLAPYADPEKPWRQKDLDAADRRRILPLLAEADRHDADPAFEALLAKFASKPESGEHWELEWSGETPSRP